MTNHAAWSNDRDILLGRIVGPELACILRIMARNAGHHAIARELLTDGRLAKNIGLAEQFVVGGSRKRLFVVRVCRWIPARLDQGSDIVGDRLRGIA